MSSNIINNFNKIFEVLAEFLTSHLPRTQFEVRPLKAFTSNILKFLVFNNLKHYFIYFNNSILHNFSNITLHLNIIFYSLLFFFLSPPICVSLLWSSPNISHSSQPSTKQTHDTPTTSHRATTTLINNNNNNKNSHQSETNLHRSSKPTPIIQPSKPTPKKNNPTKATNPHWKIKSLKRNKPTLKKNPQTQQTYTVKTKPTNQNHRDPWPEPPWAEPCWRVGGPWPPQNFEIFLNIYIII